MKRTIRAFTAAALICASAAFAQQSPAPSGGPQPVDIFAVAREQVERQQTQPGNNAPVWREVASGKAHYASLPGREMGVLIQSEGEAWRRLRPSLYSAGGGLIAIALVLLMAFYAVRGPIGVEEKPTGRYIRRFSATERIAHWTMGLSFVLLAITGLVLTFGKFLLLPVVGYALFGWLATLSKNLHNFVGPIFAVVLPVFIVIYLRHNIPAAYDFKWFAQLGGLLTPRGQHPPSGKFNAGEKALFWLLVCVLCVMLVVSGLVLNFPNFEQTRQQMQLANSVHLVAAMLGIAMACFHVYLGTIGHKGAYEAMRYGYVEESWAREHHPDWYEEVAAGKAREKFAEPDEGIPEPVRAAAQQR